MDFIAFGNNHLLLRFSKDESGHVRLSYFGKEINLLSGPESLRSYVECEISEDDHFGSHDQKHCQTPFGLCSVYVSHSLKDGKNSKELVLVTKNRFLEISTHFVLYSDCASLTTYNVVKNIFDDEVNLEYVSSFYLHGLGKDASSPWEDMYIRYARSSWYIEAQWEKHSFTDLGLYNGNEYISMRKFELNNTGSWSTKDYLPMIAVENGETGDCLLSQIENNGSWHIEVSDHLNRYYLSVGGPELNGNSFSKKLLPGETFTSCKATTSFGKDFEKAIQEMTRARRHFIYRNYDYENLPIIYNDYMHGTWDLSGEKLVRPMVDVAASFGCEEFVMDAGWFAKTTGWTNAIGAWEEEPSIWPSGGLKGTCDYIHSKGMRVGLWFEIENMGKECPLAQEFPDDYFFQVNHKRTLRNTRYPLNFANPKVYDWALELLSDRIRKYGLDYIKLDYNVDAGIGNDCGSDSLGEGLLKNNRAVIRFFRELESRFPDLTIENCGSGGCRMDYEMLKVCPIQSTSDQTSYRKYPYLAGAVLTAAIPEQAAVWAYPVSTQIKEEITDEIVIMNMVNAMLGRIHLSSYIEKLAPSQQELIREGLRYYTATKEFKKGSVPVYPNGIGHFFDKDVTAGLLNDDRVVLSVWNTSGTEREVVVDLSAYDIVSVSVGYPTSIETDYSFDKENGKLKVRFHCPYGGRVFDIRLRK